MYSNILKIKIILGPVQTLNVQHLDEPENSVDLAEERVVPSEDTIDQPENNADLVPEQIQDDGRHSWTYDQTKALITAVEARYEDMLTITGCSLEIQIINLRHLWWRIHFQLSISVSLVLSNKPIVVCHVLKDKIWRNSSIIHRICNSAHTTRIFRIRVIMLKKLTLLLNVLFATVCHTLA